MQGPCREAGKGGPTGNSGSGGAAGRTVHCSHSLLPALAQNTSCSFQARPSGSHGSHGSQQGRPRAGQALASQPCL